MCQESGQLLKKTPRAEKHNLLLSSQTNGFRGRTACLNKELLNDRMVWIGRDCKDLDLEAVLLEQVTGQKTS